MTKAITITIYAILGTMCLIAFGYAGWILMSVHAP